MNDPQPLIGLLERVSDLISEFPEGKEILDSLKMGTLSVEEAAPLLLELAKAKGLGAELTKASGELGALVPELNPTQGRRPLWTTTSTGVPQLNPLYEAALVERAFLDGDIPELRHGPLPRDEKARPAVPILTTSRDPVIVGVMLETASNQIAARFQRQLEAQAAETDRLLTAGTSLEVVEKMLPAVTGVEGYLAAVVPDLREVEEPGQDYLMTLSEGERRIASFRTLSTTQGRRTVAKILEDALLEAKTGYSLVSYPLSDGEGEEVVISHVGYGPQDVNPEFNFIENALAIFAAHLRRHSGHSDTPRYCRYRVIPFAEISARKFGWILRFQEIA